jgi:hypothetical protein
MQNTPKPSTGYVRLNEELLRPGDIILVTQSSAISASIRLMTWSDISHAMVYVEDRSVIDATFAGVQASNTQRLWFESDRPVHVLRLKTSPTPDQLQAIILDLRAKIGTRYSVPQVLATLVPAKISAGRRQFCSRLVAQAFAAAGIKLVAKPDSCTPGRLKRSALLVPVPNATVPVSEDEMNFFDTIPDLPKIMHDTTNNFLAGVRTIASKVEDFQDVADLLAKHPEQDAAICAAIERSDYLKVWRIEQEKNPWQYDLDLMNGEPQGGMADYCWNVLRNETQEPNRYIRNRGTYDTYARQSPCQYFRIMAELHQHLARLHATRVDVAQRWLEAAGELPAFEPDPLVPHTSEWFSALAHWSPAQSAMTRHVVEAAGNLEVCSICGDDPAADYRLPVDQRSPAGVDTLRLCDDCLQIREMGGEAFEPL